MIVEFIKYNANPKNWNTNDCVIRAIAVATQQDWLTTFDKLYEIARKKCRMLNSRETYNRYLKEKGFEKMKQEKNGFGKSINIHELINRYPDSILVISCRNHLTVAIKGILIDTWNAGYQTSGVFYKKDILDEEEGDIIRYLQFIEENKQRIRYKIF